ncbi:restriction endonuclease [Clostridium butyricum]|nr:restriction endonuclease [Clostridium butyricum]
MTGSEFEIFVGELFKEMGYKTTVTKASGDQGIDVVAEKNGLRFGVQAKCYSNTVSNSAIQEVVAGISFYKCDKAIVITNNFFTNSAIQLAKANDVVLWNREMLKQKIEELFS